MSTKPDGRLRQCCRADNFIQHEGNDVNIDSMTLAEAWNLPYMRDLRKSLLQGDKPSSCNLCWEDEDFYSRGSRRQHENQLWSQRLNVDEIVAATGENGEVSAPPIYWDLRLGNKCNLKCVMCNPQNSSLWMKDISFQGRYEHLPKVENPAQFRWGEREDLWEVLLGQLSTVREFYFSGGEPLLSREHLKLLRQAVEDGHARQIHLRYDTNGVLLTDEIISLWSNFASTYVNLSIDGLGETLEYVRYPIKWLHLQKAIRRLEEAKIPGLKVNPQFSLSNLTALAYLDFIDWKLKSQFRRVGSFEVTSDEVGEAHVVDHPRFLSLRALPQGLKKEIRTRYETFSRELDSYQSLFLRPTSIDRLRKKLSDFLVYMEQEDWEKEQYPVLLQYLKDLDAARGTDSRRVIPWIK